MIIKELERTDSAIVSNNRKNEVDGKISYARPSLLNT